MAFQVALEDAPVHKTRVDHTPYLQAIEQGKASGKTVAITLPTEQVKKTISTLRQAASKAGHGLQFDNVTEVGNGESKIRFMVKEKRVFSQEAIAKRKATMKRNGTKAGRAAKKTAAKKTVRKAS